MEIFAKLCGKQTKDPNHRILASRGRFTTRTVIRQPFDSSTGSVSKIY